jgi:hypothetical protein
VIPDSDHPKNEYYRERTLWTALATGRDPFERLSGNRRELRCSEVVESSPPMTPADGELHIAAL